MYNSNQRVKVAPNESALKRLHGSTSAASTRLDDGGGWTTEATVYRGGWTAGRLDGSTAAASTRLDDGGGWTAGRQHGSTAAR